MRRKYPLEPVERVRADKADAKARALADAFAVVSSAASTASLRAADHAAHDRARRTVLAKEQERLELGEQKAHDLLEQQSWAAAAEAKQRELAEARDAAITALSAARREAEARRAQLQLAQAELKVIEKHHEAYGARARQEMLASDEEAAEDAHLARWMREIKA